MIALVTGASRGIGAAIARSLAAAGHDVALACRREVEKAGEVAGACRALGVRAEVFQADISREEDCRGLIEAVHAALGAIGILVNNAGLTRDGLAMRMSLEQFTSIVDTNLTSTFLMCRGVLPDMVKARQGADHQFDLGIRPARQRRASQLCRGKGRYCRPDPFAGQGGRAAARLRSMPWRRASSRPI